VNVLALCADMIFRTKIESTAASLGANVVRRVEDLGEESAVVLVDLDSTWPDVAETVERLRRRQQVRLVAFGSHVRKDLFAAARQAGIEEVMPRSVFVTKLPSLLSVETP
jgi:hypothetical protein